MATLLKICGTTSPLDARLSQEAGADFLGVILNHPASPRSVSLETAREIAASTSARLVALSVNQPLETLLAIAGELRPHALQLHGDETPELVSQLAERGLEVWKAVSGEETALFEAAQRFREAGASAILVDARETSPQGTIYGGTGQTCDWNAARALVDAGFRVILAGGLAPANVARAIETVRPWMIDVVSGVEARKGAKDPEKVRQFAVLVKAQSHSI